MCYESYDQQQEYKKNYNPVKRQSGSDNPFFISLPIKFAKMSENFTFKPPNVLRFQAQSIQQTETDWL
jgi:hypothetical protein